MYDRSRNRIMPARTNESQSASSEPWYHVASRCNHVVRFEGLNSVGATTTVRGQRG